LVNVDLSQFKVLCEGLLLDLVEQWLVFWLEKVRMKNLYFLLAAGCMVFSQAHADTELKHAQTKSQAEAHYLSAFWDNAQTSHLFVNAFSDSMTVLVMGGSESVSHLVSVANVHNDADPSVSAAFSRSTSIALGQNSL
jgi:hypothetical protein